ncbi:AAA family ATPase [Helicobacter felis]|uniref:AAA family ATPase n=1 Tax=Helicobacter felis TaxID=214 RepID=UPI000CF12B8F|nr:AAA family ATPase [Helicobacter felis]
MQEVGYYDLREILILKGVRRDLEERISKRIFNDYGLLPKSYAFDFEQERQAYVKTLLKKQGRIVGVDAYDFPKEGEQKEVIKIDFSQIAQDCGEYWFFPQICKERQSTKLKQPFTNSAQIENFIRGCFSFSKQICDYVVQQYLKGGYGGLFGDLKISFEAFKRDLLEAFKDHNFKLPKALCQLEPYCVDGDLVFAITPSHAKKTGLSKQFIDDFYKLVTQEEEKNKADLNCLIAILCGKRLGFTPSHKEKRLMRLRLERDCGLLEPAYIPKNRWLLEKALKDANIPFARVLTSQQERCYYFPIGFKLWVCARLKDVFKRKEFASTLEALYEQLLHKGQGTLLTDLKESSKPDAFWDCVCALLSHVQLPVRSVVQKERWHMDKTSGFFSLALLLNQEPTSEYEICQLLMLQDTSKNKESHTTQQVINATNSKNNQNAQRIAQLRKEIQKLQEELDAKEIHSDEEYLDWEAKWENVRIKEREVMILEKGLDPLLYLYDDLPDLPKTPHICTPQELAEYLSCVSGQDEAKQKLCVTLSDHHARFHDQTCPSKINMLLIGPSGSGKTFMTTTLLKKLNIPYYIADASSLTPAGWRGEDVQSMFVGLYQSAGKDIEKAQKGVIFLDEVDKLGMEVSHEQFKSLVQNEFLKLMEGHSITFNDDKSITLKTDGILFIFAGHFKELYTSLNTAAKSQHSIGFINTAPTAPSQPTQEVSSQDLQRCGFSKEFIGRIVLRVVLEPVNPQMLADALEQELKHFQDHFKKYDSVLEMEEKAKEILIQRALQEGTGMRAIKTLLTQVIHPLRFDMEEWRGFVCVITPDTLNGKGATKRPLN